MQEGPVVLGYWAIRGLAERLRMLLEYTQTPYTEEKYTPETAPKWFGEVKPKFLEKNPAANLPFLHDGDMVVCESEAICIYLCFRANKPELLGRDANEKVQLATVYGVFKDLHGNYIKLVYGTYNEHNEQTTFKSALTAAH